MDRGLIGWVGGRVGGWTYPAVHAGFSVQVGGVSLEGTEGLLETQHVSLLARDGEDLNASFFLGEDTDVDFHGRFAHGKHGLEVVGVLFWEGEGGWVGWVWLGGGREGGLNSLL